MVFSNVEGMTSTSTVSTGKKESASKIQVPCSDVIKMYHKRMGGVDVIDQRAAAYLLDQISTIRFYLRIFFDLMDANSYIVCNMMHPIDLTLLDIKTIVSTYSIGRSTSRSRASPYGKKGSKRKYQYQCEQGNLSLHLPEFQNKKHHS